MYNNYTKKRKNKMISRPHMTYYETVSAIAGNKDNETIRVTLNKDTKGYSYENCTPHVKLSRDNDSRTVNYLSIEVTGVTNEFDEKAEKFDGAEYKFNVTDVDENNTIIIGKFKVLSVNIATKTAKFQSLDPVKITRVK